MTALDNLPHLISMLGVDLRSAAYMISALGIVHIVFYGCTFFLPMTYHLVTIWLLVTLYSGASIVLIFGVYQEQPILLEIWIWYSLVFVAAMFIMLLLMILVFSTRQQYMRLVVVLLAMLWYLLTIYFIFVVNSYRIHINTGSLHKVTETYTTISTDTPKRAIVIDADPIKEPDTDTEIIKETETDSDTKKEPEKETDTNKEPEKETDTNKEPEKETDTKKESEIDNVPKNDSVVLKSRIRLK